MAMNGWSITAHCKHVNRSTFTCMWLDFSSLRTLTPERYSNHIKDSATESARQIIANIVCSFSQNSDQGPQNNKKIVHLYVFVEMDWLIVDIVPHEEVIDTGQEGHLRQGEYVHELFHSVAMGTLQGSNYNIIFCCFYFCSVYLVREEMIITLPQKSLMFSRGT